MKKRTAAVVFLSLVYSASFIAGCSEIESGNNAIIDNSSVVETTAEVSDSSEAYNNNSTTEPEESVYDASSLIDEKKGYSFNKNGLQITFPESWETYETVNGCYSSFHNADYSGIVYIDYTSNSIYENCKGEKKTIGQYEFKYENSFSEFVSDSNAYTVSMYTPFNTLYCLEVRWILKKTNEKDYVKFLSSKTCKDLIDSIILDPDDYIMTNERPSDSIGVITDEKNDIVDNSTITVPRLENKEEFILYLGDQVYQEIMLMEEGTTSSISEIVYDLYKRNEYSIEIDDDDLWDIMDIADAKLSGKKTLDFSYWEDRSAGLPYNLTFVVRNVKED